MSRSFITAIGFGLLLLVLIVAMWTAGQTTPSRYQNLEIKGSEPKKIAPSTARELERLFNSHDYEWPPNDHQAVPPLVVEKIPGDFPQIADTQQRKSLFLRALLPIVMLENRRIREQRKLAQWLFEKDSLPAKGTEAHAWLTQLAQEMRITEDLGKPENQAKLLKRLDEIPPALALAQSAIESGWGTSRFALEGNSLFGQWTYKADNGLKPNNRDEDKSHLVASFPDLQASVRAYMRNLNTGRAYREFRETRATMREANEPLSPVELANHLRRYSQRGMDYVKELQVIINSRTLATLHRDESHDAQQAQAPTPLRLASLTP
jgi:Bax protein